MKRKSRIFFLYTYSIIFINLTNINILPYPTINNIEHKITFTTQRSVYEEDDYEYKGYIMDEDGKNIINLNPENRDIFDIIWSPDGEYYSFIAIQHNRQAEMPYKDWYDRGVYIARRNTNNTIRVTPVDFYIDSFVWSPDSSKLLLYNRFKTKKYEYILYILDLNDLSLNPISHKSIQVNDYTWSEDGKYILFSGSNKVQLTNTEYDYYGIYSFKIDTNELKLISKGSKNINRVLRWSVNNSKITYIINNDNENNDLYITDYDGNDRIQISPFSKSNFVYFDWSPDGKKLAYITNNKTNNPCSQIYVVYSEGKEICKTENIECGQTMTLLWSHDSKKIAFMPFMHSRLYIYTMKLDGSVFSSIHNKDYIIHNRLFWMPDNKNLLYSGYLENDIDTNLLISSFDGKYQSVIKPEKAKIDSDFWDDRPNLGGLVDKSDQHSLFSSDYKHIILSCTMNLRYYFLMKYDFKTKEFKEIKTPLFDDIQYQWSPFSFKSLDFTI